MDPLGALLEHHAWATRRLIDRCAALPADQPGAAVPGTCGTVERTAAHDEDPDSRHAQDLPFPQAIHHGTHLCTILGAHGLELPARSGWAFLHEVRT